MKKKALKVGLSTLALGAILGAKTSTAFAANCYEIISQDSNGDTWVSNICPDESEGEAHCLE